MERGRGGAWWSVVEVVETAAGGGGHPRGEEGGRMILSL